MQAAYLAAAAEATAQREAERRVKEQDQAAAQEARAVKVRSPWPRPPRHCPSALPSRPASRTLGHTGSPMSGSQSAALLRYRRRLARVQIRVPCTLPRAHAASRWSSLTQKNMWETGSGDGEWRG